MRLAVTALLLACVSTAGLAQEPARTDSGGRVPRPDKKDDHSQPVGKAGNREETSFKIGGYVKLDVIGDLAGSIGNQFQFKTATIAVDDAAPDGGRVTLNARESRVNADLRLPGHLRAFVEGDFYGDGGSFHLRHAYGELGHLLAGQTWTTFMDIEARPLTFDFEGPDTEVFLRQAMVRWTQPLSAPVRMQFAVENPSAEFAAPDSLAGAIQSQVPDLIANLRWTNKRGHIQVAGLVRQLRFAGDGDSPDLSTTGWGINATLVLRPFGKDHVYGQAMVGKGVAHYLNGRAGLNGDAVVSGDELIALPTNAFIIGYEHHWSNTLRSGISYAWSTAEPEVDDPGFPARLESARANLFFLPHPHVDVAGELLWGQRRNENGATGTAWRLQGGVIYHFGWKFVR